MRIDQWQKSLAASITCVEELANRFSLDLSPLGDVVTRFPMRITPYYLDRVKEPGDPIWRQCVPDLCELENDHLPRDPLNEKGFSVLPGLIHRYPDRVVWLVSPTCATFCRFCMRKHQMAGGQSNDIRSDEEILDYIESTSSVRDVILSGGDPLLLSDDRIENVLADLRKITHVEIVRIHTRAPVTLPERITPGLCRMLSRYHPLYINTHFNHPSEITPESACACSMMADAGIPLGNQTVLLKGVNDDPLVMKNLMHRLLKIRVRPYYIHHADLVGGTAHFRTSIGRGLDVMRGLRGFTSGLAVPSYMVDLPGGKGKAALLPENMRKCGEKTLIRNYRGEEIEYPDMK